MANKEILFLCHRIPYPPNKGDKIRAFHLLQGLAEQYTVHLGTFIDAPEDWAQRPVLDAYCAQTCYRPLAPRWARLRSLAGLLSGQPLSFPYYRDRQLQQWVNQLLRERPLHAVVVFSSTMAQYVETHGNIRRVLDCVDVDSEKWRQYAQNAAIPMRWVYAREGRRLLAAERRLAASFAATTFVSKAEAELFCSHAPECAARVHAVPNGVDSAYFDPALDHADPYAGAGSRTMVFTGAMDYRANVDAVQWFAHDVLPLIRKQQPAAQFVIVGTRPAREVLALADLPGVHVTGAVADIRPYLAHAAVAVAPLRIARGLQNKVLEALAMDRPVVLTPEAATGLVPLDAEYAALAAEPQALAEQILHRLDAGVERHVAGAARQYVLAHYGWQRQLTRFTALLEREGFECGQSIAKDARQAEASA
ncbi:MAG TPA: TIGR03087 family PEP-CTERM/XrtA system glycosyltransferase [Salinisphaeraceae bacterium]|nr:TIGR03087 family PEP-CTERM/XrtA system glycosyltransferase [Salinisphaeraceae bacterium]